MIDNPDRDLLPGTNVNVEITRGSGGQRVDHPQGSGAARTGQAGVFALAGNTLAGRRSRWAYRQYYANAGGED